MAMRMPIRICALVAASLLCATTTKAALTISTKPTQNVTCSAGVCTATAPNAVLNITDLTNLFSASSVTIQSGGLARDIVFAAPFSWTSSSGLTLSANRSIEIDEPISDAGPGSLTLATDRGFPGDLIFGMTGNISFLSKSNRLTIEGNRYKLVGNIDALIRAIKIDPAGYYALAHNLTLETPVHGALIAQEFAGVFEGLGNVITNFASKYSTSSYSSFFQTVGSSGLIKDLGLENASLNSINSGGILAYTNSGTILRCHATGYIQSFRRGVTVGGLVANVTAEGRVAHSYADVTIHQSYTAGGLVGYNQGTISNSYASGDIQSSTAGGLVGINSGTIEQSFANDAIHGGVVRVAGGLVGDNDGPITDSYSASSVISANRGLAYVGGFVGTNSNSANISRSYSLGSAAWDRSDGGGFIGFMSSGALADTYWDVTTSGVSRCSQYDFVGRCVGLTDEQLKAGLPEGFDRNVWTQRPTINNGYPYLIDNPPPK